MMVEMPWVPDGRARCIIGQGCWVGVGGISK
jgi:hypothetical protein